VAGAIVQGVVLVLPAGGQIAVTDDGAKLVGAPGGDIAYRIDGTWTKYEILNLYSNLIYLGHGTYGVEAARNAISGKARGT
jgi:hypothetical protein